MYFLFAALNIGTVCNLISKSKRSVLFSPCKYYDSKGKPTIIIITIRTLIKGKIRGLFLDFNKTFDVVDRGILLHKLKKLELQLLLITKNVPLQPLY